MSDETITNEAAPEAVDNNQAAPVASAPQGDTSSDAGKGAEDGTATADQPTETPQAEPSKDDTSKSDLLGDIKEGDPVVPDSYEPFTTAAGEPMNEDDAALIAEIAKDQGLTQEAAQTAASVADTLISKMVSENEAAVEKTIAENAERWKELDPDNTRTLQAQKAVQHLGNEVKQHLKDNGYLNDSTVMGILADFGNLISEGKSISGKPAPAAVKAYPNTPELYD